MSFPNPPGCNLLALVLRLLEARYKCKVRPTGALSQVLSGVPKGYTSAANTKDRIVLWDIEGGWSVLLHEIGHLILGHSSAIHHSVLLRQEKEAWDWARREVACLGLPFHEDMATFSLNQYEQRFGGR